MRKSPLVSLLVLFALTMLLSGCIYPYWWDDGFGHGRGGGHHDDGGGRGGRGGGGGGRHSGVPSLEGIFK